MTAAVRCASTWCCTAAEPRSTRSVSSPHTNPPRPCPPRQDFIQLEVFGRGNNAYRWAGEADVFEALDSVEKRYRIDPARIVLRGFSMGGAGTWHIGLHHPSRWVAMEAGAGFTETKRYAKLKEIPPYQEATLHIYDAVDYSLNAVNLPVVGYGGEIDPQLQGSTNIREQLTREDFHFRHEGLELVRHRSAIDLPGGSADGPQISSRRASRPPMNSSTGRLRRERTIAGAHPLCHLYAALRRRFLDRCGRARTPI